MFVRPRSPAGLQQQPLLPGTGGLYATRDASSPTWHSSAVTGTGVSPSPPPPPPYMRSETGCLLIHVNMRLNLWGAKRQCQREGRYRDITTGEVSSTKKEIDTSRTTKLRSPLPFPRHHGWRCLGLLENVPPYNSWGSYFGLGSQKRAERNGKDTRMDISALYFLA